MSRTVVFLVALALSAAACTGDETPSGDPAAPRVVTTPTAAPLPATVPSTVVATSQAPPSTSAPVATSTTAPPSTTTTPPVTEPPVTTTPIGELKLSLETVADGFSQPVLAVTPPGDSRLFVVDQPGRIWVVSDAEVQVFIDIRDAVRFRGEQGLLGLAFHPEYGRNGLFYVYFIANGGDTVLAEFAVDPDNSNRARPGSRRDILVVSQPASNHNGGMIGFGPDGLLWVGLGDGGGSNDRYGNGQRADRRLGSMIRIAVGPDAPEPYGDPPDGPFVESGGLPEVWSIGLRNPWRWAFDDGDLYIADVGQNAIEEINVVPVVAGGLNFGWPILEGDDCFRSGGCDRTGLVLPVYTYTHSDGCSVTGGFVYRGSAIPELRGRYFFGDFCSGWVDSIVVDDGLVVARHRWLASGTVPGLTSFGVDDEGELYVMTTAGDVRQIVRGE